MNKTSIKRILCIVCVLCMTVSMLACCNGNKDVVSGGSNVSGTITSSNITSNGSNTTSDGSSNSEATSTDSSTNTSLPSGMISDPVGSNPDWDPYKDMPKNIKGQVVRFATWIDHENGTEAKVPLANMMEDIGIGMKTYFVEQVDYETKLLNKINAGDIPDIFVENNGFPRCLDFAAPIDTVTHMSLDDPIWDKDLMEYAHLGDHYYLVNAYNSPWREGDLVFFNKTLFEENGIKSPAEYYEDGEWTWANFEKACREISALGKDYYGCHISSESLYGTVGVGFADFDKKTHKFVNNSKSQDYVDVIEFQASLTASDLRHDDHQSFINGKTGMYLIGVYGLKSTGYFADMDPEDLGFTYPPAKDANSTAYVRGIYRMYGIIDGAPHADAAGYALRYFLDYKNYELDNTFVSDEAMEFYYEITAYNPYFMFIEGLAPLVGSTWFYTCQSIYRAAPGQVQTAIDAQANLIQSEIDAGNQRIAEIITKHKGRQPMN